MPIQKPRLHKGGRPAELCNRQPRIVPSCSCPKLYLLRLVAQTLLVTIFAHALSALVLCDLRLSFLFQ
jgi:hypothetical protein